MEFVPIFECYDVNHVGVAEHALSLLANSYIATGGFNARTGGSSIQSAKNVKESIYMLSFEYTAWTTIKARMANEKTKLREHIEDVETIQTFENHNKAKEICKADLIATREAYHETEKDFIALANKNDEWISKDLKEKLALFDCLEKSEALIERVSKLGNRVSDLIYAYKMVDQVVTTVRQRPNVYGRMGRRQPGGRGSHV